MCWGTHPLTCTRLHHPLPSVDSRNAARDAPSEPGSIRSGSGEALISQPSLVPTAAQREAETHVSDSEYGICEGRLPEGRSAVDASNVSQLCASQRACFTQSRSRGVLAAQG